MTDYTDNHEPAPFFEDTRSVAERLNAEQRDWIPAKSEGPSLLTGLVLERGTYTSDIDGKEKLTAVVLDKPTAAGIEWNVIAFHGYLRTILERDDPRPGDWIAWSYNGTKPSKRAGESDANVYRGAVERNPDGPLPAGGGQDLLEDIAGEQAQAAAGAPEQQEGGGGDATDDIPF